MGDVLRGIFNSTQKTKSEADNEKDFQELLREEKFRKTRQEEVNLSEVFFDTLIRPIKEWYLYG